MFSKKNPYQMIYIRPMIHDDLHAVQEIQAHCYSSQYLESRQTFECKLTFFPDGCFVAFSDSSYAGYIISHPWKKNIAVPLNTCIESLPECDIFHLHDCAVVPEKRGERIGSLLTEKVVTIAASNGFESVQLISVQKSVRFWSSFGFKPTGSQSIKDSALAKYGTNALLMSLDL